MSVAAGIRAGGRKPAPPLLEFDSVDAGYGRSSVLSGVTVSVAPATIVALLGANGAGKTTLLRVASGLLRPRVGKVMLGGKDVTRLTPHERTRLGLCLVPEGRGVFRNLTVRENLELFIPKWAQSADIGPALEAFPALKGRLGHVAGSLSGGQQQMVAISRAYLCKPDVVLLDEVSMGLAPIVVSQIFASLQSLAATGCALLIVEQYVSAALRLADDAYVLSRGTITFAGSASELDEEAVASRYLA